jgi:hypothetical protein
MRRADGRTAPHPPSPEARSRHPLPLMRTPAPLPFKRTPAPPYPKARTTAGRLPDGDRRVHLRGVCVREREREREGGREGGREGERERERERGDVCIYEVPLSASLLPHTPNEPLLRLTFSPSLSSVRTAGRRLPGAPSARGAVCPGRRLPGARPRALLLAAAQEHPRCMPERRCPPHGLPAAHSARCVPLAASRTCEPAWELRSLDALRHHGGGGDL